MPRHYLYHLNEDHSISPLPPNTIGGDQLGLHVAETEFDGVRVSTVFTSLNMQHSEGPPVVFETMVFGGDHDGMQLRYSTWDQAEEGHQATVIVIFGVKQGRRLLGEAVVPVQEPEPIEPDDPNRPTRFDKI